MNKHDEKTLRHAEAIKTGMAERKQKSREVHHYTLSCRILPAAHRVAKAAAARAGLTLVMAGNSHYQSSQA